MLVPSLECLVSISSMAEDAALRFSRSVPADPDRTPRSIAVVGAAAGVAAANARADHATEDEVVQRAEAAAAEAASGTGLGEAPKSSPGPLSQLVKYIPTETIALYLAIQGALGELQTTDGGSVADVDFTSRWMWFWGMLALTIVLTAGLCYRSQKNANPTGNFSLPTFEISASAVAFAVWALSLPNTPLLDFDGYDHSAWNSVLILGGTITIAVTAYVLGKTVSWQKVVPTTTSPES